MYVQAELGTLPYCTCDPDGCVIRYLSTDRIIFDTNLQVDFEILNDNSVQKYQYYENERVYTIKINLVCILVCEYD